MLPPPMTRPTPTPMSAMSLISSQNRFTRSKSNTDPLSPASASPDNLSRTREYATAVAVTGPSLLTHLEPHEAPDRERRAGFLAGLRHELLDRLRLVTDPFLVEQRVLLVELVDLSVNDLAEDVLRLAGVPRLLLIDPPLSVDDLGRDLLAGDAERDLGNAGGNVLCDRPSELDNRRPGAASDVDQNRDASVVMHVRPDHPVRLDPGIATQDDILAGLA